MFIVTGLFIISALCIYKFFLYPLFFSPLASIPNANWLSAITPIWMQWKRFQGEEVSTFQNAFMTKGSIVRVAPNEIAVNNMDAIRVVHGYAQNNCTKTSWYSVFMHNGARNCFSSLGPDHSMRRHRISSVYTKPYVQASPHVRTLLSRLLKTRLLPALEEHARAGTALDVLPVNFAFSLDFVSSFIFGLSRSTNFLQNIEARDRWLESYATVYSGGPLFWLQEYPDVVAATRKLGISPVPKKYFNAVNRFDSWIISLVDATEVALLHSNKSKFEPGEFPEMYHQLRSGIVGGSENSSDIPSSTQRLELASECLDHLVATRDTFGIVFSFVLLYLSRHPKAQERLREELQTMKTAFHFSGGTETSIPSAKSLESLPYLNAVLKESIRLRGNVPTSNPRITPASTLTKLGPYENIPPGVRVSAFAWCLHRKEEVFPDAEAWIPDRWLDDNQQFAPGEQERWFWAFGTGSRRCLGQNLALEMLRFSMAAIFSNFEVSIHDDTRFINASGFVTGKKGESLELMFKPL
ncbi:Cytochrome P450 [Penicillium expansum]|uniref:Cytochrome P450 n=1 Tax=Penicillium expansum TaxID=27334 RepID=A0A0A2JQ86_PENEN|nr:Cytochrome P450 [Penicillium expansum]KGO57006.1 Cytochrome P450 [Penicillium expansum]